jgi:hypothetical protein
VRSRFCLQIVTSCGVSLKDQSFPVIGRSLIIGADRFLIGVCSRGYIDEVIMPHSTRRRVAKALRTLRNKVLENPWKKHDNIPL